MADLLTIRPEARDEWRTLVAALDLFEAAGHSTPCQSDPEPFGSDDRVERREAAVACSGCPLLEVCDKFATANSETANVWGGSDRTVHPQTSRRHRREAAPRPPDPYTGKLTSPAVRLRAASAGVTPQGAAS